MVGDPVPARWAAHTRTVFLPWLLLALAFVVWLAFQSYQLVSERQQLNTLKARQGTAIETAGKLRASLDALATRTAKLDAEGNASAHVIVEELRKRGVTINPEGVAKPN